MKNIELQHPEWLQVKWEGNLSLGYNQEWYTDEWQRLAGCGPTTATQLMSYISFRDGLLDASEFSNGEKALERMNLIWDYVKPRFGGGLYKTHWFQRGLQAYFDERNLSYEAQMLNIFPFAVNRPKVDVAADFIARGLSQDSPVGFLNRHRGKEEGLSTWHWVPIIGLRDVGSDVRCFVYDEGIERQFSLKKWLKETILGGGLVYVDKK